MKVSLNTIKQYTDIDLSVDDLVTKINEQLGGVEEVVDLTTKYSGTIVVKVVDCIDHPDSDHLHVCMVDDGGVVPDMPRDEQGHVQVVCGAPNVRKDMYVVWLPPGSTVPSSFDESERFVLGARKLRGVMSNGMLASAKELALGDDHDGILEIDPQEWKPNDQPVVQGASFAELYGLNDTIIDIENKMFTHRPDCFGQLGVAREIAGIQQKQFTDPEWYWKIPEFSSGEGLPLEVFNDTPHNSPRFMAVVLKDIAIKPSPLWLQCELIRLGGKPINNIVDATNYTMLLTAQPTHAYDYDKIRGHTLGVRMAKNGETVKLLNGKSYSLTGDDIVIADGEGPVGLAGIMGGGDSEVDANTRNIILEVASFDMYAVRKSSMRHGVFTDALTRFNKGQSPLQNDRILHLLMTSIKEIAGGEQVSNVFDLRQDTLSDAYGKQSLKGEQLVGVDFINERLGLQLAGNDIEQLLRNVHFACSTSSDDTRTLSITAPFWRTDIEQPEDIVEEVGRLYGFDRLPRELPARSIKPTAVNQRRRLKRLVAAALAESGANEVLTYSFVNENVLKRAGQDASEAFRLGNALSPDLQLYRLSVLPSLLDKVHPNIKAGFDEFALFEIGKGHNKKTNATTDAGLPGEIELVDLVYASKKAKQGAAFYQVRKIVDHLAAELNIHLEFKPIEKPLDFAVTAPFELSRSALIESVDGVFLGIVGELKQTVLRGFKLPDHTAAMSLDFEGLLSAMQAPTTAYQKLSRFPYVTQDISLKVAPDIPFAQVYTVAAYAVRDKQDRDTVMSLTSIGIYQPDAGDSKTITLRLKVTNHERTLTDAFVATFLDAIAERTGQECQAIRV